MKRNLFNNSILLLFLFATSSVSAQNWTWKGGSKFANQNGEYGIQGNASPANMPGARELSCTWKDTVGNLWLFGGVGYPAQGPMLTLNDLWKYDVNMEQWTWMKGDTVGNQGSVYGTYGVPSAISKPGARNSASFATDKHGDFWMFSGTYNHNELWKYDVSLNYWGWMKGSNVGNQHGTFGIKGVPAPANTPGGRRGSVCWGDTLGNIWMYGGYGYASSNLFPEYLNDMWKYNTSTGQWTWVNGDSTTNILSVIGTMEVFGPTNKPGSRTDMVHWVDEDGYLWMFGGVGYSTIASVGPLNDLWKFSPYNGRWACYKTCTVLSQYGEYGTKGVESATNFPGGRCYSIGWCDGIGNLWMFGGKGKYANGMANDTLNDLWKYNRTTKQWAWMSGDSSILTINDKLGIYGTLDVPDPANLPSARLNLMGWSDEMGNIMLFGGSGWASQLSGGRFLNDLWMYSTCAFLPPAPDNTTPPVSLTVCGGQGTTLSAHGIGNISWYDSPTAGTFLGAGNTLTVSSLSSTNTFYAQDSTCAEGSRTAITVNVNPVYNYTESHSICNGQTYVWHGQSLTAAGTFYDNRTSVNGCDSTYTLTLTVNPVYAYSETQAICSGDSLLWQGSYRKTAGVHNANYTSVNSCDSTYALALNLNPVYAFTETQTICSGDSLLWQGSYRKTAGVHNANYTTVNSCDSTYGLTLNLNPVYAFAETQAICSGDSLLWQGSYRKTVGVHNANYLTTLNCDSTYTLNLTVNPLPLISITNLDTFYCLLDAPFMLTGNPSGGTFTGDGLLFGLFSPTVAGVGAHLYTYEYTDGNGCTNTDSVSVNIQDCLGMETNSGMNFSLYPNPSAGSFTLQLDENASIEIYNATGSLVYAEKFEGGKHDLKLNVAEGVYLLKASNSKGLINLRIVIQR